MVCEAWTEQDAKTSQTLLELEAGFKDCVITPVGSRTIEKASRRASDWDVLIFSPDPRPHILDQLGFRLDDATKHYEPSSGGEASFNSWRRGKVNVILTYDRGFAERYRRANSICQELKIKKRSDRVTLFKALLYPQSYKNAVWQSSLSAAQPKEAE